MGKKHKVLVLSSVALSVGPAKIAEDYYKALNSNGIDSDLMLLEADEEHPEYLHIREKRTSADYARLNKMNGQVGWNNVPFFYKYEWNPMIPSKDVVDAIDQNYDIVFVVFWQEGFSFQTMKAIYNKLHCLLIWCCVDYSTMAGGCHFIGDCERYKVGCGKCTAFHSTRTFDFTRLNTLYRKWIIRKLKPVILVNDYMKQFYDQSYLWRGYDRIEILKSAIINTDVFRPIKKSVGRKIYGIEEKQKVILFGCQNILDERKGFKYLITAFEDLYASLDSEERSNITVVGVGNGSDKVKDKIPFDFIPIRYVEMNKLPEIYSMADCFACASVNDAGPMMVNQALCCGTPVVGFDMGAVKSVVKGLCTGYCAILKDTKDLANGIRVILDKSEAEYREMCVHCREIALQTSSYEAFAEKIKHISNKYCC